MNDPYQVKYAYNWPCCRVSKFRDLKVILRQWRHILDYWPAVVLAESKLRMLSNHTVDHSRFSIMMADNLTVQYAHTVSQGQSESSCLTRCLKQTNQSAAFQSRVSNKPIRGQQFSHVSQTNQSEGRFSVTCLPQANQRAAFQSRVSHKAIRQQSAYLTVAYAQTHKFWSRDADAYHSSSYIKYRLVHLV